MISQPRNVIHRSHSEQRPTFRHSTGNVMQRIGEKTVDGLGMKGSAEVFHPRVLRRIGGVAVLSALTLLGLGINSDQSILGRARQDVVSAAANIPDAPGAVGRGVNEFLHKHSTAGQTERDLERLHRTPRDQIVTVIPGSGEGAQELASPYVSGDPNLEIRVENLLAAEAPVEGNPGAILAGHPYEIPEWLRGSTAGTKPDGQ